MISWPGVLLLSAWLVALILGISEAPTWGWGSTSVIGLLIVSVVLAVVWVIVEARSAHPLIDMNMMRIPAVWTTNLVALLLGVGMYAVFAFLPEFLQTPSSAGYGFGVSITKSGLILLPMSIFMFAFGMLSGRLSKRFGSKSVLVTGLLIGIFAYALLTFAHTAQWQILLAMVDPRRRLRPLLRVDVDAGRRRGATRADGRRERHERQRPHDWRLDRRGGHEQHRHLGSPRRVRSLESPATPTASRC